MHKKAPRLLFNNYTSRYEIFHTSAYEILISKTGKAAMNVNRLRTLSTAIYKINPPPRPPSHPRFMNKIVRLQDNNRLVGEKYKNLLKFHH